LMLPLDIFHTLNRVYYSEKPAPDGSNGFSNQPL
jgi:hypothetical protein